MLTIPMIDWVAQGRPRIAASSPASRSRNTARRPAPTGSGSPTPATACARTASSSPATIRTTPTCRRRRAFSRGGSSTWSAAGAPTPAAGSATTSSTTSRASGTRRIATSVRPAPTMDEIRDKTLDFAQSIKAIDPTALVVGPEEWGWSGYFYSGYDQQYGSRHGWGSLPDRASHGGADYLPWFLDQLRQPARDVRPAPARRLHRPLLSAGRRVQRRRVDARCSCAATARRARSGIRLRRRNLDRRRGAAGAAARRAGWHAYYPGTRIGITEYNWGAEDHINGATAQADILGIFGREGLDMAARWTTPASSTPTYKAMKMYRNYDGNKSTFGDTSVAAAAPNPDSAGGVRRPAHRRRRADRHGRSTSSCSAAARRRPSTSRTSRTRGTAQVWQLTSANSITRLADVGVRRQQPSP